MAKKPVKRDVNHVLPSVIAREIVMVPIDQLIEHPANPRDGDVGAIAESIEGNDFYAPLTVQRSTGYILAGNHRMKAARALGMTELPVVYVDKDDAAAIKLLLADNRTSDRATNDDEKLLGLLKGLADDENLYGTAFSAEDVQEVQDRVQQANDDAERSGRLLDAVDVTIADPRNVVKEGDIWQLGEHTLVVIDPVSGWSRYVPYLRDVARDLLCVYPGPIVALTKRADRMRLVLVQPDPYIAGHVLDRYEDVHGAGSVSKMTLAQDADEPSVPVEDASDADFVS